MNTTENNKLIAEFMGYALYEGYSYRVPHYDSYVGVDGNMHETPIHHIHSLKFHTSWDWLIPIVEKIESIIFDENNSFNVTIGSSIYCVIQDSNGECYDMTYDGEESKLAVVYKAVVEFIKWYNENKEN